MAPPPPCHVCESLLIAGKTDIVRCSKSVCNKTIHRTCGIPSADVGANGLPSSFVCRSCHTREVTQDTNSSLNISHFNVLMAQLSGLGREIAVCNTNVATCNTNIDACKTSISDLSTLLTSQSERLDNCFSSIQDLRAEYTSLQDKIGLMETKIQTNNEDIYTEARERLKRENNVIITGIPDQNNLDEDLSTVNKILVSILPKVIHVTSCFRLGKFENNKTRAIKVILNSREEAVDILRNKFKLSRKVFPNARIKPDLTPMQLQHLSQLRTELNERKQNGEESLTIKYIKNVPQIVYTNAADSNKRGRDEEASPKRDKGLKVVKSSDSRNNPSTSK